MQPGTSRALILIVLLGLSMVPFIVAPPESHDTYEYKDGTDKDYNGEKAEEFYRVTTSAMELKRDAIKLEEFKKVLGNMSRLQQFEIGSTASDERTERLLTEALNLIKHIKSCDVQYWFRSYLIFLEKLYTSFHPEKFIFKHREESTENARDSSITKENSALDNMSTVQQSEVGYTESELRTTVYDGLVDAEDMIKDLTPATRRYWFEAFVFFLQNLHDNLPGGKYNRLNSYDSFDKKRDTSITKENSLSLDGSPEPDNSALATANLKPQESSKQTFQTILPELENVNVPTLPDKSKSTQNDKETFTSLTETMDKNVYASTKKSLETRNLEESRAITESLTHNNAQEFHSIPVSTETYIAHESKYKSASTEISILQKPQAKYVIKKTNSPQESTDMPEPLETLSKNQSSEHDLQIVKAANTEVPVVKQLYPLLDNPNRQIYTKVEFVNNHIVLHDYFDELEKELVELARSQALKNSQNNSSRSTNESGSPSLTTVNRNSFKSVGENREITGSKPLQESTIMPLSSKKSLAMADETTTDRAAPEITNQQTVQIMLEAQTTLPKHEKDMQRSDNPESTTIALAQNNEILDKDELVRELEELPMLAALERSASTSAPFGISMKTLIPANTVKSAQIVNSVDELTPIKRRSYKITEEEEKMRMARAKKEILKQIHEAYHAAEEDEKRLRSLGIRGVQLNNEQQKTKIGQEARIRNVNYLNPDKTVNNQNNPNAWKPFPSPYPLKHHTNNSFEGMHINLSPMKERVITSQLPVWAPYTNQMITDQKNIRNILRKLKHENFLLKTQLMSRTQRNRNVNKIEGTTFPEPGHLNQFVPHETRYPAQNSVGQGIQYRGGAAIYTPYPYLTNPDPKNFTLKEGGKTSTLVSKSLTINTTNSEFSDEMKRQLRDGKVILLSDSVVHSNFETGREKDEGGKVTTNSETEAGQSGMPAKIHV